MGGSSTAITVARGDGIGPEIMQATLDILQAAGAQLEIEEIEVGLQAYKSGFTAGIRPEAWESLRRTKVFLKAPITTPQGKGMKSLNVTIRKTMGLFANVRPCIAYAPFVETRFPKMDVVIVRENEEDLYAGIEHQQTEDVVQCLKLISRPGSERIIRYAFEYAKQNNRKKVTCFTKDNIMKLTDGLFHRIFNEVAAEYPEIESEHWIIDIGTALLAERPMVFDVIVTQNLYGDIISDVAAQVTGSVGLGGSANIGEHMAMFEAIHGSAPDIAGKGIANPSGLLLAAVQMLVHIGQGTVAERVHNAWMKTLEDGIHTGDIYREPNSKQRAGTSEFAQAVIERIGQEPTTLTAVRYGEREPLKVPQPKASTGRRKKELVGVDVFVHHDVCDPAALAEKLKGAATAPLTLRMLSNRGVKVWPEGAPETFCTDHWRCRYRAHDDTTLSHRDILELLASIDAAGIDFIKTEHLYTYDGEPGYSLGQGE